ncbi:MAG: hypothetical protein DRH37_02880 [Deltaproteobacteria bacterium]|nr:MAG: hypothetical protein DRH37_02880 [Deltaproteobacteria bacterium]
MKKTLFIFVIFLTSLNAYPEPAAWFGAEWGYNGLLIVSLNQNRKHLTIDANHCPRLAARLFYDDKSRLEVTDLASWSGSLSIVRFGPYKGIVLASQTGVFNLSASYMNFSHSVSITVKTPNDSDNDKMLDSWEIDNFGSLSKTAAGDEDSDGISNLDEFYNGTDPNEGREIFAFPPLHRYPYSNGFYAGPDVNLEWFGSTTLGRYELEVAIFPGCDKIIYRAEVYNTNSIGDPIVHTADLSEGIGTQCAYRIRAAFTNATGWTEWNNWRPFKVLEPLTNHTLYLENGEPLRGCYFFFWDYNTNSLIDVWNDRGYLQSSIDSALEAIEERVLPITWKTNDELCSNELTFLRNELKLNTVFLDQWAWRCFVGGIAKIVIPSGPNKTNYWEYNTNYWSPQFNRDNTLCKSNEMAFLPWLSLGGHWGMAMTSRITSDPTNQHVYHFLEHKYNTEPIEKTLGRRKRDGWYDFPLGLADITGTNYQKTWIMFINEYVERYSENTNDILNSLTKVNYRGKIMPMVSQIVEHRLGNIRDFGDKAIEEFRLWLSNRYGNIKYLNSAWNEIFVSWDDIQPREQHEVVFRWSDRGTPQLLVRACDDFDEFTIERQVHAWLKIREEILKNRDVCFAVEHAGPFYSVIGSSKPSRTDVPVHRMSDFADVIIQRHGFDVDSTRQKSAYADWRKSGKYIIYAPIPVTNFEDHTSLKRYYTKSAYSAGANAGFYSWNELWDLSAMILKFGKSVTNGAKRYFNSVNQRETSLLENGSFEHGLNKFIPSWSAIPSAYVSIDSTKSIDGEKSLRIEENHIVTIKSKSANCNITKPHLLLFYAFVDGKLGTGQVTIDVSIGNSSSKTIEINTSTYFSETQQCDADLLAQSRGDSSQQLNLNNSWKETENHWMPFYEFYETGELSGDETLQLEIHTPNGVKLYIDRITLTEIY